MKKDIRTIIAVLLLTISTIVSCASRKPEVVLSKAMFEAQTGNMPEPVWRLFYAVKESLDYGLCDEERAPKEDPADYERVTAEILALVKDSFEIFEYSVEGMEYRMELRSQKDQSKRYLATRSETFEWKRGKWVSLGEYVYV